MNELSGKFLLELADAEYIRSIKDGTGNRVDQQVSLYHEYRIRAKTAAVAQVQNSLSIAGNFYIGRCNPEPKFTNYFVIFWRFQFRDGFLDFS